MVPETATPGNVVARCIATIDDTMSGDIWRSAFADIPPNVDAPPAVPCPRRPREAQEKPMRGLTPTSSGIRSVRTPNVWSTAGLYFGTVPGCAKSRRSPLCSCQASDAFHSSPIQTEEFRELVLRGVLVMTRSYAAGRLASWTSMVRYE